MMLGNLSARDFENRLQINLADDERQWFDETRQENVSVTVESNKWHCFDIPFMIVQVQWIWQ